MNAENMRRKEETIIITLLTIVILIALAGIGVLVTRLVVKGKAETPTGVALEGVDEAIAALDKLEREGFYYEYHFRQEIPIAGDIPIQQDLVFPFEGNIPINTTVKLPIDAGVLGSFVVEVPLKTSVYVNTSVPIHIDQTFHLSTTVPLSLTIPIDIQPGDPAIQEMLGPIREWLIRLKESF